MDTLLVVRGADDEDTLDMFHPRYLPRNDVLNLLIDVIGSASGRASVTCFIVEGNSSLQCVERILFPKAKFLQQPISKCYNGYIMYVQEEVDYI